MQHLFRNPTPNELLAKQLDQAQRHLIAHQAQAEEHSAWVGMLNARIARIQLELKAMNTRENKENNQ